MRTAVFKTCVLTLILFMACAPTAIHQKRPPQYKSLETWPDYFRKNQEKLRTVKSNALITLESPSMAGNFPVEMIFAAPDTLFMKAEGPLGIDLGKIFVGRSRFILYNQFNNSFVAGSLDDPFYSTFLETNLTLQEIKNAIIGYPPLPADLKLVDEKHGIFLAATIDGKNRVTVNTDTWQLETIEIYHNNKVVIRQEYAKYITQNNVIMPRLIRLILPQKKEMVAIYHKNIKINSELNKDYYSIVIGPKVKQLIISD